MQIRSNPKLLSTALATLALLMVAATSTATAQTFHSLYSFTGSPDGANPYGDVIMAKTGTLYGTTRFGGTSSSGSIYNLIKDTETVLYSFTGGADGSEPFGGLVMDNSGNLYGTTPYGGSGDGTVFALSSSGTLTTLCTFTGTNGSQPFAGLLMDTKGNLYGTTESGGASNNGTVFKVNLKTKKETVLYSFAGSPDGAGPLYGRLLADTAGNLYGTTVGGGAYSNGTVWELTTKRKEKVLYSFCPVTGCADGTGVFEQSLAMDTEGNLYGTTEEGGSNGTGTAFKLNPKTGKETVLYSFTNRADGGFPSSGLVRDSQGNLYGTTQIGGTGDGVVFKVKGTKETVLHSFDGTDGANPFTSPLLDSMGTLYGVTTSGGTAGDGTVFSLRP